MLGHIFRYICIFLFSPLIKAEAGNAKGILAEATCPAPSWGTTGAEIEPILRQGKADNLQMSTFSSGQYFKYLHSHVPF